MIYRIKSYAKLNICLDINGLLEDNFHNLSMVNTLISLHDTLIVKINKSKDGIVLKSNNKNIPLNNKNIIYKVIEKFKRENNLKFYIEVNIIKRIPMEAGLAGGSSNGAVILNLLNEIFKVYKSKQELINFILPITSDGAFLLFKDKALLLNKGEIIKPIKSIVKYKILLLKPKFGNNTASIYKTYDSLNNNKHVNTNNVIKALETNNFDLLKENIDNVLIDAAIKDNKNILKDINLLKDYFEIVSMTGSGSTLFAITKDKKKYNRFIKTINKKEYELVNTYHIL